VPGAAGGIYSAHFDTPRIRPEAEAYPMRDEDVAQHAHAISPFLAMEVLERAVAMDAAGQAIIHMEVGEPDFPTPPCVVEAAQRALKDGRTKYTHSQGTLELREAICEHYATRYRVPVTPDRVIVTAGSSPAIWMVLSALLEPGDQVILSDPHYACYPNFVRFCRGEPAFVDVMEEDGFRLDPRAVRERCGPRVKAILVNSPANPTGAVLSGETLAHLTQLGPLVISDEIYHGLTYEGEEHSILEYTQDAVVLNGFSKAYAMTGWRLGYAILPPPLVRPLQKMCQNFFVSPNDFVQAAGVAALREAGPDAARLRAVFAERRRTILDGLRRLGFGIAVEPTGAFYVLANARRFTNDSHHFAFEILERAKVGVTPGIDFGRNAEGYLRFSYAASQERIAEALSRLERFLTART
jgi:aspartate/methionine/tyrosine aminotransferase